MWTNAHTNVYMRTNQLIANLEVLLQRKLLCNAAVAGKAEACPFSSDTAVSSGE